MTDIKKIKCIVDTKSETKQALRPVMGPTPPPHASVDLNSHPQLSSWRSYYTNYCPLNIDVLLKHKKLFRAKIILLRQVFYLLIFKWGNGSPESWASFLSNFSFLRPSVLDLGSGTGQTDGQREREREREREPHSVWA